MREIKFRYRLRNKEDNQHIIVCVPLYSEQNGLMQFPIDLSVWEVLSVDRHTGFIDKNEKEIYEKDILRGSCNYYTVEFDEKFGRWNMWGHTGETCVEWVKDKEVIGNAYDDSEILD
jgi:hypothetical protein